MSAALAINYDYFAEQKLSAKPPIGQKPAKPRLVWKNPKLSAGRQKENYDVKANGSYGRVLYNWSRYYDPQLGRYIASDPVGLDGGLNTYLYVEAKPTRFVDPEGESPGTPGYESDAKRDGRGDRGELLGNFACHAFSALYYIRVIVKSGVWVI